MTAAETGSRAGNLDALGRPSPPSEPPPADTPPADTPPAGTPPADTPEADGPAPVDVLLSDGSTAHVRRAVAADRTAIATFHERLSSKTSTLRYFRAHPRLDEHDLDRVTSADPSNPALVAERDGRVIALAEYHRAVGADDAEVAFVVDDAFQGRGLGTLLLEHLASLGRHHGVRRFVADTLATNLPMLAVLRHVGFATVRHTEDGVTRVVLDIAPSAEAVAAADRRDTLAVVHAMQRVLRPRSIAVIGASRRAGAIGHELVRNLVAGGFQGPVFPVNPKASSVASLPCWPSVTEVPGDVDLAVIAVPAPLVPDTVRSCGAKGVGALVVVSSGFAETGPSGASAQQELTALAHEMGMRLIGPNCFGVVDTDPDVSMNATFAPDPPLRGSVGFASQSGGLGIAILAESRARRLGLSSFVSMGNKADVSGNDLLTWWEQDPATTVVLLYLESFGNPRRFARLAQRIGRTKPIVAVKGGRTRAGAAAAASHTAALASSEQAVAALFHQSGVVRVDTVEELFDVSELLVHQPLPAGCRLGIVTNAGGPGVLAADACAGHGLDVPTLHADTQATLRDIQPDAGSVHNPIDLGSSAPPESYRRAVELVLGGGEVDAVLVVFTPPLVTRAEDVAHAVVAAAGNARAAGSSVPLIATFLGTGTGRDALRAAEPPIPCFTYPETAVRALAHAASYSRWRSTPLPATELLTGVDANEGRRRLAGATARAGHQPPDVGQPAPSSTTRPTPTTSPPGAHSTPTSTSTPTTGPPGAHSTPTPTPGAGTAGTWLTGAPAMAVLDAFGVATQPTVDVTSGTAAVEAATRIGFPVALKALGPTVVHKSDVGGVHLNLQDATAVRQAYEAMSRSVGPAMTGASVQSMAEDGVEMIAGFVQDPQFGPVVLVGMGGTTVELLGDHRVGLAPLGREDARELVLGLRGSPLLTGFRGSAPLAVEALVDIVVRMGRLAEDLPEVAEADCNPVLVTTSGAVVVDARLRLTEHPAAPDDDRRRLP
ncbi:MAG: GNAT family N-acetyltransferase [Actinomycetota bacterium]|nr:GNAT family N-acetyltransferase [Actinomycetota bacterium]